MKNGRMVWIMLCALFIAAVVLVNVLPGGEKPPYSSRGAEPDGTKAAYLLLSRLGFRVERKTGREYGGDGVVIALGPGHLRDSGDALVFESDWRFTNARIGDNADEFVALLWPYRDKTIVFEEYGRGSPTAETGAMEEITISSITPRWVKVLLPGMICAAFFALFFYGQRLGAPLVPKGFSGRPPLESVQAMAGAMEKARVCRDCADLYYRYCVRGGDQWDTNGEIGRRLEGIRTEGEALRLLNDMDRRIKEYRHESKTAVGRPH